MDDAACGSSCVACDAAAGRRCIGGSCELDCPAFQLTFCENGAQDFCADFLNDPDHCGDCATTCPGGTCEGGHCTSCSFTQPDSTTMPGLCSGLGQATGPTFKCPNMPAGSLLFEYAGSASDACAQTFRYVLVSQPVLGGGADIPTSDPGPFDFTRYSLDPYAGGDVTLSLNLLWCYGDPTCDVSTAGVTLSVQAVP